MEFLDRVNGRLGRGDPGVGFWAPGPAPARMTLISQHWWAGLPQARGEQRGTGNGIQQGQGVAQLGGITELQGSSNPPGLCVEVLWPPDLFFSGPPGGNNNPTNASITVPAGAMRCTPHHIFTPGKYVCRWGYQVPGRGRDSKPGSAASLSGRVSMPEGRAPLGGPEQACGRGCGVRPAAASGGHSPLCAPALPAVSATPGAHVPCGNLSSLCCPPRRQLVGGMGDKGRVGSRAPAKKQEPAGQGETSSLRLLRDPELLGLGLL